MIGTQLKTETNPIVAKAIASVGEIATLPEVTVKIIRIVEDPKSTARDLHAIIKNDPALSSRLLKVVNSAFYGLPGQIASIDRAIVLLGLSAVKNIAIAASMTHLFQGGASIEGFSGKALWKHSLAVAVGCRLICASHGKPAVEEGFLTGLLHDLGLLIMRQVFPKKLAEVMAKQQQTQSRFVDLEQEIIGADHQAFGMALAAKWRFPRTLCTGIGYHHRPMDLARAGRELAMVVHVADILACRMQLGLACTAAHEEYDDELLEIAKLDNEKLEEIVEAMPEQVALAEDLFAD